MLLCQDVCGKSGQMKRSLFLLVVMGFLAGPLRAMPLLRIDDVWPYELACRHAAVSFYRADGSLLLRAKGGALYAANGSQEGMIRQCERIQDRTGSLQARRDASGRYFLANGSLLGRIEPDGRVFAANGALALRIRNNAVYLPSGQLLARFRID
jgi:hypothetical protein